MQTGATMTKAVPSFQVVHITSVHPPYDARIFHKQVRTLIQSGIRVALIAQHDDDTSVDGVKILALPSPGNRVLRILRLPWRVFRLAVKQRARVYHLHDPELLPVAILLKLTTRAKVVYDVHENVPKQILTKPWLPRWTRKGVSLLYRGVEQLALHFVDEIVIAEDSYIENYQGRKNVCPIRNYPILSLFPVGEEPLPLPSTEEDAFCITYIGGITRCRGVFELLEAIRYIRSVDEEPVILKLVGPVVTRELEHEIRSFIHSHGMDTSVVMPGPIPHGQIFELLKRSHLGVAILHPEPNYLESIPTKLFEYMAAGIPVIVSDFPLWKEVVTECRCGLVVDPLNPQAIAEGILHFIGHPVERAAMGASGRQAALRMYSWETEGQRLLDLYEKLLTT
jgi:glycosyltransferase involved in cell wall biosynthesis